MKDNYIIYLGGSITQSVNFKYLKKQKYKIILIDQNPDCYCRKFCDYYFNISQTNIKKILSSLKKFFKNKKFNVIECFGVAHYSYPSVNKIKLKYIKNSIDDKFLMHKSVQKKKLKKNILSPDFMILPNKEKIKSNSNYYWDGIYNFCKKNNFNVFFKSDLMHQGQGIIEISSKLSKINFVKKYKKLVFQLFKNTKIIYLEKKIEGRLLNIDFIKKLNDEVIFFPPIYRDKVILKNKKKFLTVFQYLNKQNLIKKKYYDEISNIIKKLYKGIATFGTLDVIINKNELKIIEWSPHFHNSKIYKFLNNIEILDIYMRKLNYNYKQENYNKMNVGGYIYILNENKDSNKLLKFVKKNSMKILIDYIDTKKRKIFLRKHAFVKKNFHIVYFKTNSSINLQRITNYLEKNKNLLYS